ncbi:MAG TPA: DMT family transporter [Burkholderiaceae bacterium]|nr:DMT family transporter [Burkholderiaceae bacterium]
MNKSLAYFCLALSMALVGSYVALSKPLTVVLPIFLLAWLRFGIGGLAMLHWLKKPSNEAPMSTQTKRLVFIESFLGNFLFSICMLYGVSMTSALNAGIIMSTIPAVVAVLSWVFLRERIGLNVWLAVACGVLGIALFAISKSTTDLQPVTPINAPTTTTLTSAWLGNVLLFCAVLCEAAYAVIGKKLTNTLSPKRISALINLWGFVLMTPLGIYTAWQFNFASVANSMWWLLIFYALAASVWTVWLWMTGLKIIPSSQAGVFTVFLPVSAAVVGVLVLGERMNTWQFIALCIALMGVLIATLPQGEKHTKLKN